MDSKNNKNVYTLRSWRNTLDRLSKETGTSLKEVSEYIGAACSDEIPGFYIKMPHKRAAFIGIGMAFKQPVDVINQWITDYARKRKLYVKDLSEDLVWLYLINANLNDKTGSTNYYRRYEEYQAVAYAVFRERWDEIGLGFEDTADVEVSLGQADYGPEYDGIKAFVAEHMDAFCSAYAKPRALLDNWLQQIISTCREHPEETVICSLNSMRGWLDDSMINFLSGDVSTVNVIDRKTGKRSINIKRMPKSRRKYIAMCMALGMTTDDIDNFLEMMGYAPIDVSNSEDGKLLMALTEWETVHPLQREYKNHYFKNHVSIELSPAEEYQAVRDMLQLRRDIEEAYRHKGYEFIYV
ncbi:MAG: hypothetical protein IKF42_03415 [Mogibacterium sp.]|nr:hypothetical protein [Mogibacterium sp.]